MTTKRSLILGIYFWFKQTAFTSKNDYGKEDREAKWVLSQRTLQGLMSSEWEVHGRRSSLIAEQARRRAEIARCCVNFNFGIISILFFFFFAFAKLN